MIFTIVLICVFIVLTVLDYDVTSKILARGGREMNPLISWFVRRGWLLQAKAAQALFGALFFFWLRTVLPVIGPVILALFLSGYLYVVIRNFHVLKEMD